MLSLEREIRRALPNDPRGFAVHFPVPDAVAATRDIPPIPAETVSLWSGGWSGAPAALLNREELEWEIRWGETNEEGTGLEQWLRRPSAVIFPSRPTAQQVVHLARVTGKPVCGGYYRRPDQGTFDRIRLFHNERWWSAPTLFLDLNLPIHISKTPTGALYPDPAIILLHLVIGPGHCPDPHRTAERIAHALASDPLAGPCFSEENPDGSMRWQPVFAGVFPDGGPADLQIAAATVAPLRRTARLNRDKISATLRALSPYRSRSVFSSSPEREHFTPEEFQGSTEGHLTMREGGFTIRFASGRIAGIADDACGAMVARRATGYVQADAGILPETSYLTTDYATWFSGPRFRGVEERASARYGPESESRFQLLTRTMLVEDTPGARMSYTVQFPTELPLQKLSVAMFQIPIRYCNPGETTELELVDADGVRTETALPAGAGHWTVATALLRIPAADGPGFWIGSAEPGRSMMVVMEIERLSTERGLLLAIDPILRFEGVLPEELAATRLTGSLILAPGNREPGELHTPDHLRSYLSPFSRTVPE